MVSHAHRPVFAIVLPCLVAASGGAAQSTAIAVAEPIVATAQYMTIVRDTIPAGPVLTTQSATASATLGFWYNEIVTQVEPLANGVRWNTRATTSTGGALIEAGSVLMVVRGSGPGTIRVRAVGSSSPQGSTEALVDVGADGTIEVRASGGTVNEAIRACIDQELRIRVVARAQSVYSGSATLDLTVTFTPGPAPAQVTGYGSPCGLTLATTDVPDGSAHHLAFAAAGADPNGWVWFACGVGRAALPIPGSPCVLLTSPLAIAGVPAGPLGTATLAASVPGPLHLVTLHAQAITLDAGGVLRASNGNEIVFRDC